MKYYEHPKMKEAFKLYCEMECAKLPSEEELSKETRSPEFDAKMRKLIRRYNSGYYVLFGTAGRRVASVAVALLVGLAATTFSVKALREPVVQFITEVFEKFTSILFVEDEPAMASVEFIKTEPEYVPDGYEVERKKDSEASYKVIYINANTNNRIYYNQYMKSSVDLTADTENCTPHPISVHDLEGIAYRNKNHNTIVFYLDNTVFYITSQLSEEELLKIAESIPIN